MPARVSPQNGLQSALCDLPARRFVADQLVDHTRHALAIFRNHVVLPWTEKALSVVPWRADESRTTRKRLKNADGWNSTEPVCVLASRNVQCQSRLCVSHRRDQVRQVPSVLDTRVLQRPNAFFRISHSVHQHFSMRQLVCGADQEFHQFSGSFFITPIPDPQYIPSLLAIERAKHRGVCRLMERPNFGNAETVLVNLPNSLPKREHSVDKVQMELKNLRSGRIGAMVSVMQQNTKGETSFPLQNGIHQPGIIPLMQYHDVGTTKLGIEKFVKCAVLLIEPNVNLRICLPERIDGLHGEVLFVGDQVLQRPRAQFLVAAHLVARPNEFPYE